MSSSEPAVGGGEAGDEVAVVAAATAVAEVDGEEVDAKGDVDVVQTDSSPQPPPPAPSPSPPPAPSPPPPPPSLFATVVGTTRTPVDRLRFSYRRPLSEPNLLYVERNRIRNRREWLWMAEMLRVHVPYLHHAWKVQVTSAAAIHNHGSIS